MRTHPGIGSATSRTRRPAICARAASPSAASSSTAATLSKRRGHCCGHQRCGDQESEPSVIHIQIPSSGGFPVLQILCRLFCITDCSSAGFPANLGVKPIVDSGSLCQLHSRQFQFLIRTFGTSFACLSEFDGGLFGHWLLDHCDIFSVRLAASNKPLLTQRFLFPNRDASARSIALFCNSKGTKVAASYPSPD